MRLLILSDLHREVWRDNAPPIRVEHSRPDLVILAGDIDQPARALAWAQQCFAGLPVIYVSGNHEGYGDTWENALRKLAGGGGDEGGKSGSNIHVLDRAELIQDGVRFLGATLWTDYDLFGANQRDDAIAQAEPVMLDYKRIRLEHAGTTRALTPHDTIQLHQRDLHWLREKLAQDFDGPTVVVTHMAPSMRSVAPRYAQDLVSAAFASNLDALAERATLWVHGHTHDSFDYQIGHCRVVCNPCGYVRRDGGTENPYFDPDLIVEL